MKYEIIEIQLLDYPIREVQEFMSWRVGDFDETHFYPPVKGAHLFIWWTVRGTFLPPR